MTETSKTKLNQVYISEKSGVKYLVCGLVGSLALSSINPFLSIYLVQDRDLTVAKAAELLGVAAMLGVVLSLLAGRLNDRFSRRSTSRVGAGLAMVLPLALTIRGGPATILAAVLIANFGSSLFGNAVISLIHTEYNSEEATSLNAYYYAAHNVGAFIAPLLIYAIGLGNLVVGFTFAFVCQVCLFAWFWRASRDRLGTAMPSSNASTHNHLPSSVRPLLLSLLAAGACFSLVYSHFYVNVPHAIGSVKLFGKDVYPALVALNGLVVAFLQPLQVRISRHFGSETSLVIGSVLLLPSFLLLLVSGVSVTSLLIFVLLFTGAEALFAPAAIALLAKHAPTGRRSTWLSWYNATRLTSGPSNSLGGSILQTGGMHQYLLFASAITLPLIVASLVVYRFVQSFAMPRLATAESTQLDLQRQIKPNL